jgi:hypothetical protein
MSTQSNSIAVEQSSDVIAGLREIADFLEEHPEVTDITAHVWQRTPWNEPPEAARERLTTFAQALGAQAREQVSSVARPAKVVIDRDFHGVALHADSPASTLAGAAPEPPRYEPIIRKPAAAS